MLSALRETFPWAPRLGRRAGLDAALVEPRLELVATMTVSRRLPAGRHRVRAHNTLFWKTHDIVLQPGEHARFRVANRVGWASFGLLIALGAAPVDLTFERESVLD